MSVFVDTSVFALNIATALSLGLAVDYALLMVSRYREEIERDGPTREAHRRTVMTAGRTALFSGFTVAVAMAALVLLPQRFLYSIGVAGASVGMLSAMIAMLVVPSLLALLGTRIDALSIRRGPSVSDESDGWYRLARGVMRRPVAVALAQLRAAARRRRAAALDDADRPERRGRAAGPAVLRRQRVRRGPLPARHHRGDHGHRRRAGRAAPQLAALRTRVIGDRRASPAARRSPPPARRRRLRQLRPRRTRALDAPPRTPSTQIRDAGAAGAATALVSGNTARFIDQKQSLLDHLPLVVGIVAATTLLLLFLLTGSVLLPIKTLLMNALTLARDARHRRARLPGGLARRPLRLHGPGGGRGDEPRLPLRGHLRPRDRLRGAGDGADQGAARPRQASTRRRSRSASAAPAG